MDKADAKKALRKALIEERLNLPDRLTRAEALVGPVRDYPGQRFDCSGVPYQAAPAPAGEPG